jgi:transposase
MTPSHGAAISIGSLLLIRALGIRPVKPGGQMAKKGKKRCEQLPVLHPDAAGIDIGASEMFVAVAADRDPQPIRRFPTFTRDLNALADWLDTCGVHSVAMESTSVYWIPVYQILEARGFEVFLVNAQHVKNVPGRKTDVSDCQWLQYLHSVGLLRGSFRPPGVICAIRSLWRHRASLIQWRLNMCYTCRKHLTR